jgi:hypothetical protein
MSVIFLNTIRPHFSQHALACVVTCLATQTSWVHAQTAPVPRAAPKTTSAIPAIGAPLWLELKPAQQQSLAPLAATWNTLQEGHRRKWIALAQTYPTLSPEEQQKLHSRMLEWAALKPKDRELARLNFAETKKIAPADRTANWEAYQALSPEERQKLVNGAKPKPNGAAIAVKPVATSKLTAVPAAPKVADTKRPLVTNPQSLNRSTLLPSVEAPAPSVAPTSVAPPQN